VTVSSHEDTIQKIAVIGMAGRYPKARNMRQFWENLEKGKECISFFSDEELLEAGVPLELVANPDYVKALGVYEGVYLFDAGFFGYTPREAELLDPQHRVLLECAWESLEHAGYDPWSYSGRIGAFVGSGATQYLFELLSIPEVWNAANRFSLLTYNDRDFLATQLGYKLNLRGPCITVQTACSTSLVSIVLACQSLLTCQSDIALAGGVTLDLEEKGGHLYQEGGVTSMDGHCRAFDASATGIVGGCGAGMVVLKRLQDALTDGDSIHAVIIGFGLNNDGATRAGFTAPGVEGQVSVISDAIAMAGISPQTIELIECHGTGTPIGDPIEIAALTRAFRAFTGKKKFCAIGSVKTNIGHTGAAAGVAGFQKAVLALQNKMFPPSLHFNSPNPAIDFENSPFYVNTESKDWQRGSAPRRAATTSLGAGGTNAHVILEEAPLPVSTSSGSRPWQLLVWSAKSNSALEKMTENLRLHLEKHPEVPIADVAYTLHLGRRALWYRKSVVCRGHHDAIRALELPGSTKIITSFNAKQATPVVFLFPGQGSQYLNMGLELYQHERAFREQIDICSEILKLEIGLDLRDLLYPKADEAVKMRELLDQVKYATPALFTVEYALAKLWIEWGVRPQSMIGHSLGEYVAACIAGVFSLESVLRLVSARGRLMQDQPRGSMVSILLPEQEVQSWLRNIGGLSLAAINGPSACVVSGSDAPVAELENQLGQAGIPCRGLHTSHAFHSELMEPMLDDFRKEVKKVTFKAPQVPYLSNITGTWIRPSEATDPEYWVKHVRRTVRFSDSVRELLKRSGYIFLEVGPGRALSNLVNQHSEKQNKQVVLSSLPHPKEDIQNALEFLLATTGHLWTEGVQIDWNAFHAEEQGRRVPLPTYPFEGVHYRVSAKGKVRRHVPANAEPENGKSDAPLDSARAIAHSRPGVSATYAAPSRKLEKVLAQIWQGTLGIDAVGINDNFFELGGHSLLAIQLISRIRTVLDIEITVEDLYEIPAIKGLSEMLVRVLVLSSDHETIAQLLHKVGEEQLKSGVSQSDIATAIAALSPENFRGIVREIKRQRGVSSLKLRDDDAPLQPLVPIRVTGTRKPIFLVQPGGGGVKAYHQLAVYMDVEQPIYAFQSHILGRRKAPAYISVEEMAVRYVDLLSAVQPCGPYVLGGWSLGGIVAFEMALQLKARGQEVSLVVMMDSASRHYPGPAGEDPGTKLAEEIIATAEALAIREGRELKLSKRELEFLTADEQMDVFLREMKREGIIPSDVGRAALKALLDIFRNSQKALENYVPQVYDGAVTILRAREVSPDLREVTRGICDDPAFGWQSFCARPVTVHFVPGDHMHMMAEPNIRTLGAVLQRCIDAVTQVERTICAGHACVED
jgi:phthiocerol/phenolphthiocerol synthesis type-I polyketide synthase E